MIKQLVICLLIIVPSFALAEKIEGTPFNKYTSDDNNQRSVTYYLSEAEENGAPLILMIQGSGCKRVISNKKDIVSTSIYNLFNIANTGKFSVLAVEKPFSGQKQNAQGNSVEHVCSSQFHNDFTVESWVKALNVAIEGALTKLKKKPKQILVFGFSEGAGIASQLAMINSSVTHVISSGGSGVSQMYDFIASAYQNCFDRSECINQAYSILEKILKDPNSSTKFAWGHPYKRWTSFFRLDPSENLLKSKAKVYLVFGTSDSATPALSQEIIAAKLKSSGRDITVRRISGANHNLQTFKRPELEELNIEYNLAFKWFWNKLK